MNYRELPDKYTDEALKGIYKKTSYMPEEIPTETKVEDFVKTLRTSPVLSDDISVKLLKNFDFEVLDKYTGEKELIKIDYKTNDVRIFAGEDLSTEISFADASSDTKNIVQLYMAQALSKENAHAVVGVDELRSEIERAMDRANDAIDGHSVLRINGVDIDVRVEDGKYYFESFEDINEERFKLISKEGLSREEALSTENLRDMQKQLLRHQIVRTAELSREIEAQISEKHELANDLKHKQVIKGYENSMAENVIGSTEDGSVFSRKFVNTADGRQTFMTEQTTYSAGSVVAKEEDRRERDNNVSDGFNEKGFVPTKDEIAENQYIDDDPYEEPDPYEERTLFPNV